MTIVYEKLLALKIPEAQASYGAKEPILYALSLGLGRDPVNARELPFVYEKGLKILPTYPVVLAPAGFWARDLDTGIDWVKIVHGEHKLVLHKPLGTSGKVMSRTRILDVIDKGPGKGALLFTERVISDQASGEAIATIRQTGFCRGDGGFGGPQRPTPAPHKIPDRAPECTDDFATRADMALFYRWNADLNPLHADPDIAAKAGYPKPILHGLATFGVAGHAILRTLCDYDPGRFKAIQGRFSAPVYPGETIRTEMWRDGSVVSFRARVTERDKVVLDNGRAEIASA